MFTAGLPRESETPTHFISCGMIEEQFAYLLDHPEELAAACEQAGLPVTLQELQAILAACDISDDAADVAIERLGLSA